MPYLYSDEQKQIREETRRVLASTSTPDNLRRLLEQRGEHDAGFWQAARDMGWSAMAIPEASGGLGLGIIDALIVAEECGKALVGAPFLACGFAAGHLLEQAGDPDGLLPRIAAGDATVSLATAEGSEILPTQPATRFADGRLNGRKAGVLGGATADFAIVLATDRDGAPCLATVALAGSGVDRDVPATIDNSRGLADLLFTDAPATLLPVDDPIGLATYGLGRLALHLASEGVGGADACIRLASEYANQRQAFGQAIGKFQAVKHGIAEIYVLNEMARASVLDAAVRLDARDADAHAYVAAARLNAVQAYETAAAGATQVHGGIGVTWEADLHLHYRRSRTLAAEAGPPHFWEDMLVDILESVQ